MCSFDAPAVLMLAECQCDCSVEQSKSALLGMSRGLSADRFTPAQIPSSYTTHP